MKELRLDDKLNFVEEPMEVIDREVKKLKQSRIPIVKVRWNSKRGPEFTWECEDQILKETLSIRQATSDKEKELWVELKRLYEPDVEDQLWTQTQALMHDPVEWRLYDTCGVHHVFTKDQEIFMLVEKDYPLRRDLQI
nr:putative reverse transcriptase domain-containing protein [Tanacetum cinerariifolium]